MRTTRVRSIAALAAAFLLASVIAWFGAPAASAKDACDPCMSIDVVDVSPNTPVVTSEASPLTFTLAITNYDANPMDVVISGVRSDPIGSQAQLTAAINSPRTPSPDLVSPMRRTKHVTVPGNKTVPVTYETTTSAVAQTAHERGGICLCADAVYPIYFSAGYTNPDATGTVSTQTYIPSFTKQPPQTKVSWVWPLLDRPHRLLYSKVFTDDVLADEVGPDGRLTHLLDVVRDVSADVPMTIVTDPDLIDELVQMSRGYVVNTPGGRVNGTGSAAAAQWLSELSDVLKTHSDVQIVFTPFADPAVDSLSRAGRSWSMPLNPQARQDVDRALGRTPLTDVAWPAGQALSRTTLSTLVADGSNIVLVGNHNLTAATDRNGPLPTALAQVSTGAGPATLAVTSTGIERLTAHILDPAGNGLAVLPQLVSELALRAMADRGPNYVVVAPPRDLDVDVPVAVRTIEATAHTSWSRPLTMEAAVAQVTATPHGTLKDTAAGPQLGPRLARVLDHVVTALPDLASVYHDPSLGAAYVAPFPAAIQRAESSSLLSDRGAAFAMAERLAQIVDRTRRAVQIVKPVNRVYTLTSANSQLPITVVNKLPADADVVISVESDPSAKLTVGDQDKVFTISPNSRIQLHIPLHVDHVGPIDVRVTLHTKEGILLGAPRNLTLRSTAIGTIGVIITVVAAVVLTLAVLVRGVRRFRRRNSDEQPTEPERTPAPANS